MFGMESVKATFKNYGRHIWLTGLVGGFIFDIFTIWRIDLWQEELIFIIYLVVAGASIAYMSLRESKLLPTLALQFVVGGLVGRFLIFYFLSGSLASSWPFILFLAALFVGNEVLHKRYSIFTFRLVVYFVILFSFSIFFVPILIGHIGTGSFILAGVVSLASIAAFAYFLLQALGTKFNVSIPALAGSILGAYVLINIMYFANFIPPLPLSMQEAGIYHSVVKTGGGYLVTAEPEPWYASLRSYQLVHVAPGESVYAFTSVFAPTKISTTISHSWQYYDKTSGDWVVRSRLSFPIIGGRDGGYRGYTRSGNLTLGHWRVGVLTETGQIVGRIKFVVIAASFKLLLY